MISQPDVTQLIPSIRRLAGMVHRSCPSADREDLFQEGLVGLLEAASRYDPSRNASFATFCGTRALGAMKDHVRYLVTHAANTLPSNLSDDESSDTYLDVQAPCEHSPESREMILRFTHFLRNAWRNLPEPLRHVIWMRYIQGATVREVAKQQNVSVATIVRRERAGLQLLRQRFKQSNYGRTLANKR